MIVRDKLIELKFIDENESNFEIANNAYINRIHISDLLDLVIDVEFRKFIDYFLNNDLEYDGDEYNAWIRFLNYDLKKIQ